MDLFLAEFGRSAVVGLQTSVPAVRLHLLQAMRVRVAGGVGGAVGGGVEAGGEGFGSAEVGGGGALGVHGVEAVL